jgi:hypothetical protein
MAAPNTVPDNLHDGPTDSRPSIPATEVKKLSSTNTGDVGQKIGVPVSPQVVPVVSPKSDETTNLSKKMIWGGGIFLVLSNIATILDLVQYVFKALGVVFTIIPESIPTWIIVTAIMTIVMVGNILLARFLYSRFVVHSISTHKVLAVAAVTLLGSVIVAINALSIARLRPDLKSIRTGLISNLLRAQRDSLNGGFRMSLTDPNSPEDAWTTAQSAEALLLIDSHTYEDAIRRALTYLDHAHSASGWTSDPDDLSNIRTEISSWVLIAYSQSLEGSSVWKHDESKAASERASAYLNQLLSWQDSTGAWGPISETGESFDRTYPTTMAVWALAEVQEIPLIDSSLKLKAGNAMESAVDWLIRNYHDGYGWDENPKRQIGDRFNGLNYQTMYALEKAEKSEGHNAFKKLTDYKELKANFVEILEPMPAVDVSAIPTSDEKLHGKLCYATFLGYPWSVSALGMIKDDTELVSSQRRKAQRIMATEFQELGDVEKTTRKDYTWKLAEFLIGISHLGTSPNSK